MSKTKELIEDLIEKGRDPFTDILYDEEYMEYMECILNNSNAPKKL